MRRRSSVLSKALYLCVGLAFSYSMCPMTANAADNCVVAYLQTAELQAESEVQVTEIRRALNEMLTVKPALLIQPRYADYQSHKNKWNAVQLLMHYYVPAKKAKGLDDECFAAGITDPKAKAVIKGLIKSIDLNRSAGE